MLVRGPSLASSMSQYLIDEIAERPNIKVETPDRGGGSTRPGPAGSHLHPVRRQQACGQGPGDAALFIFIGAEPRTNWLDGMVQRDARGFVLTGPDLMKDGKRPKGWTLDRDPGLLETNVPGIFAVGDVRHGSVKRVASGVGEGSIAIQFVHQYLSKV